MHEPHRTVADVPTARLCLRALDFAFLDACLHERYAEAEALLGAPLPEAWREERQLVAWRWQQLRESPAYAPFVPRAMLLREGDGETLTMVGHIGFHDAPNAPAVRTRGANAIEVGYTVFAPWRRHGFAEEALRAMCAWCVREHAVTTVVASVAPDNTASQALVAKLGFVKVDVQFDPIDGTEDVLVWHARGLP